MKSLHRPDLFCWSTFDEARNVDFNGYAWIRPEGNVIFDPVPLREHDLAHLQALGGATFIVVTNSDHVRDAQSLAQRLSARVAGPRAERETIGLACDRWLADGDELVPGLVTIELEGSKTPGELAFVLESHTLLTGDLVRGQCAGALNLLPPQKLVDPEAARRSVARILDYEIDAVLVGDGWPMFSGGAKALRALAEA